MRVGIGLLGAFIIIAWVMPADARGGGGYGGSHSVRGYTTKNGTYVAPHTQTNSNGTKLDNWSAKGNINPYTGKMGTKDPYAPTRNPAGQLVNPTTGNPI